MTPVLGIFNLIGTPQKSTHENILGAQNPHENNKKQAKKLKVYSKNVDFHRPPTSPPESVWFVHS